MANSWSRKDFQSHAGHMTRDNGGGGGAYRREGLCPSEGGILSEHIVWSRAEDDKDVNDPTLRHPVSVCLRHLIVCLEVR